MIHFYLIIPERIEFNITGCCPVLNTSQSLDLVLRSSERIDGASINWYFLPYNQTVRQHLVEGRTLSIPSVTAKHSGVYISQVLSKLNCSIISILTTKKHFLYKSPLGRPCIQINIVSIVFITETFEQNYFYQLL